MSWLRVFCTSAWQRVAAYTRSRVFQDSAQSLKKGLATSRRFQMVRFSSLLCCTGALIAGCASETSTDVARGSAQVIDVSDCVKIEGADIGRTITLEVPDADGEGTVSITFTGWIAKDG